MTKISLTKFIQILIQFKFRHVDSQEMRDCKQIPRAVEVTGEEYVPKLDQEDDIEEVQEQLLPVVQPATALHCLNHNTFIHIVTATYTHISR